MKSILALSAAVLFATPAFADKWDEMNYGPFLSASFDNTQGQNTLTGKGSTCNKGIAVKLSDRGGMLFDTDLCRMAGGWLGGWLELKGVVFKGDHGPNPGPAPGSDILFQTNPGPTWSLDGSFKDPRKLPTGPGAAKVPFGPLPKNWAQYRGLFLHGDDVVFSYTVGTAGLLELPGREKQEELRLLTRTVNVTAPGAASSNLLYDVENSTAVEKDGVMVVANSGKPDDRLIIGLIGAPVGAKLVADGAKVVLQLPAFTAGQAWKVVYVKGTDEAKLIAAVKASPKPADLASLTKGGPAHWTETVKTALKPGTNDGKAAYVVDTIEVPEGNPYKSWMRIGGMDFFADGRIAVSTESGDVWVVSGVNKDFQGEATWQRVASGLFQALGLKIVKDQIYVLGRDQITRLHDLNGDGEADVYECFNNDVQVTPGFHEFAFDLQTDSKGNFYFSKGGPVNPGGRGWGPLSDHNGCIFKISPDGKQFEVFATGVRAPNGIGVGPGDVITTGDNEGTWVPKSYVHIVKPGEFIGVTDLAHREQVPTDYSRHICFFPKEVDNSSGGQAWTPAADWGLPKDTLLHLSYGTSSLYRVLQENVGDTVQGGVVKFPLKFESGVMRARFSPIDGQLYVAGLKGWQTSGAKDAALQRVRFTGKNNNMPGRLNVTEKGITIAFPFPLEAGAADAENFSVKQWNYKWTSAYGSEDYKVSDGTKGQDDVEIKSVKLSTDKKEIFLEIDGLQPVMQMLIRMNIKSEDGSPVPDKIYNTVNAVGKTPA